ncbi:MAG: SDR family NAD(P)-dependent oxidoreductase, partial [Gaiellaceae bacterium]
MKLAGAVCLVTGASSGIGRATAAALTARGARVIALGRDAERLAGVGERQVVHDLVEPLAEELGPVDVLVNNAGIGETDDVQRLVAVNLVAPILLTRALLPGMLERGRGHVVNVASIAGFVGPRGEAVYAATKGGLIAFSESLRYELRGTGVGVTLVAPGVIATEFFERRGTPYARRWPRPIAAERVAEAIADAIERGRDEVFVPAWLGAVARFRGLAPGLFR